MLGSKQYEVFEYELGRQERSRDGSRTQAGPTLRPWAQKLNPRASGTESLTPGTYRAYRVALHSTFSGDPRILRDGRAQDDDDCDNYCDEIRRLFLDEVKQRMVEVSIGKPWCRSDLNSKCLNISRRSYDIGRHATNMAWFGATTVFYAVPRVSERAWKIPFPFSLALSITLFLFLPYCNNKHEARTRWIDVPKGPNVNPSCHLMLSDLEPSVLSQSSISNKKERNTTHIALMPLISRPRGNVQ